MMPFRFATACCTVAFLTLAIGISSCAPDEALEQAIPTTSLFKAGEDGYACFRIPAIVNTSSNTLLAFAEGRVGGCSDTGDIDLVMKRSVDGGRSWSGLELVWSDDENTAGNPAPVVDRETGQVFLLITRNRGVDKEPQIISGESVDTRRIFVMSTNNDGATWTELTEITSSVKEPNWTWYATGPGSGIQLTRGPHKGRLMVACDHIEAETEKYYSHVIFSDDHGQTWQLGGTTPQDQVNESEVAELSDGTLLLNMRNYDRTQETRKVATSTDGGMTWSDIRPDTTLIEPICQASLQRYSFAESGRSILLFSNPASRTTRERMTLRASFDEGLTWPREIVLHDSMSAYSDLTVLPDSSVGILYERGASQQDRYAEIVFSSVSIGELVD